MDALLAVLLATAVLATMAGLWFARWGRRTAQSEGARFATGLEFSGRPAGRETDRHRDVRTGTFGGLAVDVELVNTQAGLITVDFHVDMPLEHFTQQYSPADDFLAAAGSDPSDPDTAMAAFHQAASEAGVAATSYRDRIFRLERIPSDLLGPNDTAGLLLNVPVLQRMLGPSAR